MTADEAENAAAALGADASNRAQYIACQINNSALVNAILVYIKEGVLQRRPTVPVPSAPVIGKATP